jgi:hypothetical protein
MAILYKLIIDNATREIATPTIPESTLLQLNNEVDTQPTPIPAPVSNIGNWPIDFESSDWLTNFRSGIIKSLEHAVVGGKTRTIYIKIFNERAEFDIWAETTRLTDPAIKSAIAEWDSAHNITRTEIVYEMNEISRSAILS